MIDSKKTRGFVNFLVTQRLPLEGLHPPAAPRIEYRECFLDETREKTRPICPPTQRGKSVLFCGRKQPGAMRKRARKGRRLCTKGVQNRRFWRAFGDFPRDGKVTRVPSMALPCSRGAPASRGPRGPEAPSQRINRGSCSRPSCARTCPKSAFSCGYSSG